MAKRKKKTQKSGKPTPAVIHSFVNAVDIKAWGSRTLCGKKAKKGTYDYEKVTCKACKRHATCTVEEYLRACRDPLHL